MAWVFFFGCRGTSTNGKSAGDPIGDEGGVLQAQFGLLWSRTKRCSKSFSVFGGEFKIFLTTVNG